MAERCSENCAMGNLNPPSPPPPQEVRSDLDWAQPKPPFLHGLFLGPDGLRAGWRLLIYYALYRALLYCGVQVLELWDTSGPSRLWFYMVGESLSLTASVLAALVM